jgi:Domain of unknown function (DUF4129)
MRVRAALAKLVLPLLAVPCWTPVAAQTAPRAADANAAARAVIEVCSNRFGDLPNGAGLTEMEKRCPELASALQAAGVRPLIIASSRAQLDRESLRRLARLLQPAPGMAPAVSQLEPILRGLHPSPTVSRSFWRRVWDWLVEQLTRKPPAGGSQTWLGRLREALGNAHWLWNAIIWGTLIALPMVVMIFVVREVRAMGARSKDDLVTVLAPAAAGALESRLALLRQAPLGQRPAQLFAMLISRLVAAGRLPPDRSLTHREVVRRAVLEDANQRRYLESLAQWSERQLYSGVPTMPGGVEELLARGEDLYTTGWGRPLKVSE